MVDLGNEGGDTPVVGDGQNLPPVAPEVLGAPVVAPPLLLTRVLL